MKNFIIVFSEKSGSSPICDLLSNFHLIDMISYEPFDRYRFVVPKWGGYGKDISEEDFSRCLEIIFSSEKDYILKLKSIISKYADFSLYSNINNKSVNFSKQKSHGFKIRPRENRLKVLFEIAKKYNVVVFILFRKNTLKWALSKYHGDGFGKPGHLQFKLADKLIKREDIPKIRVDCSGLLKLIKKCEISDKKKRKIIKILRKNKIKAYPIYYEDFCHNKFTFLKSILKKLKINASNKDISEAIKKRGYYKKVHSENISDFVLNPKEVCDCYRRYLKDKKNISKRIRRIIDIFYNKIKEIL